MQIKVSNDFITVWKKVIKQEEQEEISSIRYIEKLIYDLFAYTY